MNLFKILLSGCFLLVSLSAKSTSFTVTDNLLDGLPLGEGSTTNSLFYVDNFLPDVPHIINSAYFEFHFAGFDDLVETTESKPGERRFFDSEIERISLQVGSTSIFTESTYEFERFIYDTSRITVDCGFACTEDKTIFLFQENEGYYGFFPNTIPGSVLPTSMLVVGFLNAADLLNLQNSDLILWSLDMLAGELILESAQLTVDYDLIGVAAVPLPAGFWLFGTALLGLAGFGKKRIVA